MNFIRSRSKLAKIRVVPEHAVYNEQSSIGHGKHLAPMSVVLGNVEYESVLVLVDYSCHLTHDLPESFRSVTREAFKDQAFSIIA
jgi:5'-deoxynucleotidase YfbR-like HD superfamily hydrolase